MATPLFILFLPLKFAFDCSMRAGLQVSHEHNQKHRGNEVYTFDRH